MTQVIVAGVAWAYLRSLKGMAMLMEINGQQRLIDIQESFRRDFPFLAIGFFIRHPSNGQPIALNALRTIGESQKTKHSDPLTITGDMTIAELERLFRGAYGLSVKVFRKSGTAWLETSLTSDWTLAEQNDEGRSLSGKV